MTAMIRSRAPLFVDRREAARVVAKELEDLRGRELVVVGLARGGVVVAAEVARILDAPLDAVAVRKVGHPSEAEYAIGAVTPTSVYLRGSHGLPAEEVARAVDQASVAAGRLDRRLHAARPLLEVAGKDVVVVDDGLATGATMIAALRWARRADAARAVAAVPVGAAESLGLLVDEADRVVCPYAVSPFLAVSVWYARFGQVDDGTVLALLRESDRLQARRASLAVSTTSTTRFTSL